MTAPDTSTPAPRPAPIVKHKPDPRPMRLGLGAAAIAALSVMAAGLVRFPVGDPTAQADDPSTAALPRRETKIEKRIRYVHLKAGQKAPPGARVINAKAPAPRVVVTRIQAPAPAPRRVVTRTRQSGRRP